MDPVNRSWFTSWLRRSELSSGDAFLPRRYPREIALLHPGTRPIPGGNPPFQASNANDAPLSQVQTQSLENLLLEMFPPTFTCCFALYGGYTDIDNPSGPRGFGHPSAHLVNERLPYFLLAGSLRDALFSSVEENWPGPPTLELSYLWPTDRSWFLASEPDLAFSVIGCDAYFGERLLATHILSAHEMPPRADC